MPREYDKEKWKAAQITTMDEFKRHLEKKIIEQIKRAKKFVEAQEVSQKIKQISQETQNASKQLGDFIQMSENLAVDEYESGDEELSEEELAKQEAEAHALAKASLLEELGHMAAEAANQENYKVAYKIERTIDSILYDEG